MSKVQSTSHGEIAYLDSGTRGSTILFIHGNSSCKEVFFHQFESVDLAGYRLVAIDLPAHGSSFRASDDTSNYTIKQFASIIREFCELQEIKNPLLVGWSLGGHIAIEAAAQNLELSGMMITGTPPVGPGLDNFEKAFHQNEDMALTIKPQFTKDEARMYAESTLGGAKFVSEFLCEQVENCDGRFREFLMTDWANPTAGHSATDLIKNFTPPIAVVHGDTDPFVNLDYVQSLTWNSLWKDNVIVLKETGHAPFLEDPETFNKLLKEFAKHTFHTQQ